MLFPSTRATWNPNVTMSVAYTAADANIFRKAISSSPTRFRKLRPRNAEEAADEASVFRSAACSGSTPLGNAARCRLSGCSTAAPDGGPPLGAAAPVDASRRMSSSMESPGSRG